MHATDANDPHASPSSPPFSLSDASRRSPAPSLATGERVGTRADYGKLAAHAIADLADSLGCPCAGIVARMAGRSGSFDALWRAVAKTVRGMATHDYRRHDQKACAEAACSLSRGEPIEAALFLSRLNGEELADWHARVTGEMVSAKAQGTVTL